MKEFIKKNFAILLAFVLPIVLIIIVALSTYLPSLFLTTNYNFVYSSCSNDTDYYSYRCSNYLKKFYTVIDGKLVVNVIDPTQDSNNDGIPDIKEKYTTRIFLHDTKNNESREITLSEAQGLTLNELLTSPDGVSISGNYDKGADFFPLMMNSGSSYGYYLMKGKSKNKLNLINNENRYYDQNNFQFIGWIVPDKN